MQERRSTIEIIKQGEGLSIEFKRIIDLSLIHI